MADLKISQLTSATTPLAGTEVVPLVQSGSTKKVSIDNLTTGKTVPANGIVFPATQVPSSNANTLDDYEEGQWTPEYAFSTSGSATATSKQGYYTKIGRLVVAQFYIYTDSVSSPVGNATITGLPFTSANTTNNLSGGCLLEVRRFATDMPNLRIGVTQNSAVITIYKQATNASSQTPLDATDFNVAAAQNLLCGTVMYTTA